MRYNKELSIRTLLRRTVAIVLMLFFWTTVHAELMLTAPPRESAEAGQKIYGPLAARLTELLGEKVVYQQPKGWLFYQRDMRADKFDIVFDGPHFISWRIKQYDHVPVAKLPGKLGFVVITAKDKKEFSSVDDLVNLPVCAIAPPNLSTLTVLAQYDNPVRQPRLITVKGGAIGVYKAFKSGKCEAAILRDKFFAKKVPEQERAGFKVIFKSTPVTNQGITVSTRVSEDQRARIAAALTEVSEGTEPILKRFAPKADKMIPAVKDDYAEHYTLLTGIIFGWEINDRNERKEQSLSVR